MRNICFVTYAAKPEITSDDALVAKALHQFGATVTALPWDVPSGDRSPRIVRSTWNYHRRPDEFAAWINAQESSGIRIWNAPATIRWNLDKFYLQELAAGGCPIIPTIFLPRKVPALLASILEETGWSKAVVKPSISATSHRTWTTTPATAASQQQDLDDLLADHGVLVQKFMPEIESTGELSLVFFNGIFSHAMQKNAAAGDFRVQEEYGGRTAGANVSAAVIEQAQSILAVTPGAPHLYARMDGIVGGTIFFVMEIELIEPCLYLGTNPQAPSRFAEAIAARLDQ